MVHSVKDLNRRNITLRTSKVGEVVPEYFGEENAKLITFLEKYHDYLDSDQTIGFGSKIKELVFARDTQQTNTDALDQLIGEIGNGLIASSFFKKPRLMAKLLGDFYRAKGSYNSARGFFQGFFGEEAVIEYPKDKLFIVGESGIGYESQKFLTNAEIYQTFSILVKCGLSTSDYENLYKRFVHPAGFHFAGEVVAQRSGDALVQAFGVDPLEPDSIQLVLIDQVNMLTDASPDYFTALLDSSNTSERILNGVTLGAPGPELRMPLDTSLLTRPAFRPLSYLTDSQTGGMTAMILGLTDVNDSPDGTLLDNTYIANSIQGASLGINVATHDIWTRYPSTLGFGAAQGGTDSTRVVGDINASSYGNPALEDRTYISVLDALDAAKIGIDQLNRLGPPSTWDNEVVNNGAPAWTYSGYSPVTGRGQWMWNVIHPILKQRSGAAGTGFDSAGPAIYPGVQARNLHMFYHNIQEMFRIGSFTFDDSDTGAAFGNADSAAANHARPDFSMTLELMDQEQFTTYTSDSAY